MSSYDNKIVYGKDLTPFGQGLMNKAKEKIDTKLDKGGYVGTANDLKGLVDKVDEKASKNLELLKGNGGIKDVFYIQDAGKKEIGKGYVDKITNELYICLVENSDTDIKLGKFELATNIENRYRLMRIEQRLGVYQHVYGIKELTVNRDENNSSSSLTYTQK